MSEYRITEKLITSEAFLSEITLLKIKFPEEKINEKIYSKLAREFKIKTEAGNFFKIK